MSSDVLETTSHAFSTLPDALVNALAAQGITEPTPVQAAVIPDALAGHDLLGRAQTGSGKTLAFGLPILSRLAGRRSRPSQPRALIILPTRELANQVKKALDPAARAVGLKLTTVYGGTPYDAQIRRLQQRTDVVVATPGRLADLLEKGHLRLDDIEMTVLDEADHLCDLGFYPEVDRLVGKTPAGSQRLLLSATLDGDVDALVRSHLRAPRRHELDPNAGAVSTMTHHTLVVGGFRDKQRSTADLVRANGRTIVFTRTREAAMTLAATLSEDGVAAVDLHGDLSQRARERNLARFSSGAAQAVVATDVAARGIHVDGIDLVVHFDAPTDPKAYLHRSGRTARAGKEGCVVTITTPKFSDAVFRMQRSAGVEVLHHDLRTVPTPMTAETLAEAGRPAPASYGRGGAGKGATSRGGASKNSARHGGQPYRGSKGRPANGRSGQGRPHRKGPAR